jgi:uncharacterized membrane protein YoaK (UPF0700 family)
VLSFCIGGIVGVLAYKAFGAALLFAAALLLFLIALPGIVARRLPNPPGLAGGKGA